VTERPPARGRRPLPAAGLASPVDCGICARPLVYSADPAVLTCGLCGKEETTLIYCPAGHFVCDRCHQSGAMDVVRRVLAAEASPDPAELLERLMTHPALPMHGPEHHAIVAGVLVAAARNGGFAVQDGAVAAALDRGAKVPGGWCGYYGACGAAVGAGVAVSVLTSATPLKGPQRSLAIGATAFALERMVDDQPRCCKRASRVAVAAASEYLGERLGVRLPAGRRVSCAHSDRNAQCARAACPYFDPDR